MDNKTTRRDESQRKYKTTLISKAMIIVAFSFGVLLFSACEPETQEPIDINYNTATVVGFDNSDRFFNDHDTSDTLYSEAVALKLTLSDSLFLTKLSHTTTVPTTFPFKSAMALSIVRKYRPINKVTNIEIKTLLDINEELKAGNDVSNQFLCANANNFDLYHSLNQGISWLNDDQDFYDMGTLFLVLKTGIKNTNAQFEIKIQFDNGDELVCSSNLFTIIE